MYESAVTGSGRSDDGVVRKAMTESVSAERILSRLEVFGTRLGLQTTRSVLRMMGDPQQRFASVLVAGTNGKGSVAALLAAIGSAAGYRTGIFTSPHLETVAERIKIGGQPIDEPVLAELLEAVCETARRVTGSPATYFESVFVAACRWFAEQQVDLAILEVGLGGRLDATNVAEPELSVITEIGLEHRQQLGDTIEAIAREKAGIMRPRRPVVVGAQGKAAVAELQRLAKESGALWKWAAQYGQATAGQEASDWSREMSVETGVDSYRMRLALPGRHQEQNLVTAIVAAEELAAGGWERIDRRAIESGVAACRWPGRLERVDVDGMAPIVLDAAHNPSAARALADFLSLRLNDYCLLFGVLDDKEVEAMLPPLLEKAHTVVLTRPRSSRGRDPLEVASRVDLPASLEVVDDPQEALGVAFETGLPVVVCGSIYLVGEVRLALRSRFGTPPPA